MAGQYYDSESGLFYNWNRYYNPATGRYISSDPIGIEGGLNTFLYAEASPVMFVDPEGLQTKDYFQCVSRYRTCGMAIGGLVGLGTGALSGAGVMSIPTGIIGTGQGMSQGAAVGTAVGILECQPLWNESAGTGNVIPFPPQSANDNSRPKSLPVPPPPPKQDGTCVRTVAEFTPSLAGYGGMLTCHYQCPNLGAKNNKYSLAFRPSNPIFLCEPVLPESDFRGR